MMKNILFVAVIFFATPVISQDGEESQPVDDFASVDSGMLLEATSDVVELAREDCRYWALNEDIEGSEMNSYLLKCVNELLQYQGFRPVSSVK